MKGVSIRTTNVFLMVFLIVYIGLSLVVGLTIGQMDVPYAVLMLVSEGILLLPVVVFLIWKKISPAQIDFMKLPKVGDVLLSIIFAYTLMPLIYLLNMITMIFVDNPVNQMLGDLYEYPFIVQLLLMAVMPAVVEEFIFRGLFYTSYRKRNILGAILLSGLIFGLIHLNINQCAYAIMMGVAFAFLVEVTGSIVNSMAAHFAINSSSVILLATYKTRYSYEEYSALTEQSAQMLQETDFSGMMIVTYAVVAAFAVAGIAIAICLLRKMAKRNNREEHLSQIIKDGLKKRNPDTDAFFDICMIITILLIVSFMITSLTA